VITVIVKKMLRLLRMKKDPVAYARSIGVTVGRDCRLLGMTDGTFGSEPYLVTLGDHVTVTAGVCFVTHDGGVWVFREEHPDIDIVAPIAVGNNVFIGLNSIIMPGVTIGNDCIVAAGSVVTREVPDGMVVGGVPAKVIKSTADYRDGALKRALRVKGLSADAKRSYLLQHFRSQEGKGASL
jgi:acetyltransferase-like isoleucine patch superfamily enzyme